jgi:predicted ATPase
MIREESSDLTLVDAAPLRPILERLLAKDPAQRFASASEVIDALSRTQGILVEESFWRRESFLQAAAFTGRDEELSLLDHALQRAKAGEGSLWLVEGESGIGKSRLLNELRIRALVEGVDVFTGQSLNTRGQPYQPWREVLHRLALHIRLTNEEIAMLKLIVPDIEAILETTAGNPASPDDIGRRLLQVVVGLFSRIQQPVLVLLEDLQWAGDESLEVLKQLVYNISGLPLLVVGTYRSDERADLSHDLPETQVLRLQRLTSQQIADLSVSMLGETGRRPGILKLLEHESEGNIFFIIEVLRALAEEAGRLSDVPTMSLPNQVFTQGIQSLIERRLVRIPPACWPMLEWAAVSGRYLDTQVLRTLQQSAADAQTRLDRFLSTGAAAAVLEIADNRWRFTHDKIREGILAKIDSVRLPLYHLRVAEAIEATYMSQTEFAAALAYHYGSAERWDKELVYSEIAGKAADHQGAYATAIGFHQRVLDLLSPEDRAKRAVILGTAGREYVAAGDFARAETYLQESLRLAKAVSDQKTMLLDLMRLGLLTYETGRVGEAGPYFEAALELAIDLQDRTLLLRSLVELAHHEAMQEQLDSARRHITQALNASASMEDPETLASVYWGAGIVATLQQSFAEATDYFQQSRGLYHGLNFLSGVLAATNNLGEICRLQGDYRQAWAYFEEVLEHRRAQGRRKSIASTMTNLGFTATGLGKREVAYQYFAESYAIALEIGAPTTALVALVGLAELKAIAGDPLSAIEVIGLALAHPATIADVNKDARPILERITADLEPDQVAAALERGGQLTMEIAAAMVFGQDSDPNTAS